MNTIFVHPNFSKKFQAFESSSQNSTRTFSSKYQLTSCRIFKKKKSGAYITHPKNLNPPKTSPISTSHMPLAHLPPEKISPKKGGFFGPRGRGRGLVISFPEAVTQNTIGERYFTTEVPKACLGWTTCFFVQRKG